MSPYADTNFFTRFYLELPDSHLADDLIESAFKNQAKGIPVTWLHRLETINAFQLHVFVAKSPGQPHVTPERAALALANFRSDSANNLFLQNTLLPSDKLESQFEELSLRHTARHGFRTYDLLHVASALVLECDTFWSFDPKANKLARLEGLRVRH
jgi:predicted nucleic acid-binding protein